MDKILVERRVWEREGMGVGVGMRELWPRIERTSKDWSIVVNDTHKGEVRLGRHDTA
jgi:hypothetical protein